VGAKRTTRRNKKIDTQRNSMNSFQSRPYSGEADLPLIVALVQACEAVDRLDRGTSIAELRAELDVPSLDPARDLRLWEDPDGRVIGWGRLAIPEHGAQVDGRFWLRVHPDARNGTLEPEILAWATKRAREVGRERGQAARLLTGARSDQSDQIALLEARGVKPVRYFFTMRRPLDTAISAPQLPDGFTIRLFKPELEAAAWVELGNLAFREHWNHHDSSIEELQHELSTPQYQPDLYLLAVAPDGTCAAYCQCEINPEAQTRTGRSEGFVAAVGTHPRFRKQGLGRALLITGLQRLQAAGLSAALISVDADNPSGALRLYESVGFRTFETWIMFDRAV
jgi:mycothiol synthase